MEIATWQQIRPEQIASVLLLCRSSIVADLHDRTESSMLNLINLFMRVFETVLQYVDHRNLSGVSRNYQNIKLTKLFNLFVLFSMDPRMTCDANLLFCFLLIFKG